MRRVTVHVPEETVEELDSEAEAEEMKRSEYLRKLIDTRHTHDNIREEYESKLEEYEAHIEDLQREIDRLRRERRQILEQREENQELVKFAQEERSLAKIREERERRRDQIRQANIVKRTWWKLAGEPDIETADG